MKVKKILTGILIIMFFSPLGAISNEDYEKSINKGLQISKEKIELGIKYFEDLIKEYPDKGKGYIILGALYYDNNHPEESGKLFLKGFKLLENDEEKHKFYDFINRKTSPELSGKNFERYKKAFKYIDSGEPSKALEILLEINSEEKNNTRVLFEIAYCYVDLKKYKKAQEYYEIQYNINPLDLKLLDELTFIYSEFGKMDKMEEVFEVKSLFGDIGPASFHELAMAYFYKNNIERAREILEANIVKYPDFYPSKLNLGIILFKKDHNCKRASALLEEVIKNKNHKSMEVINPERSHEDILGEAREIIKQCR